MDYLENNSDIVITLSVLGSMMIVVLMVGLVVFVVKRRSTQTAQEKEVDKPENAGEMNLDVVDQPFPQIMP